ncbi:MAG: hypothetical protein VYA60_11565, partial [Pseudomonadota bacterium]|nr:hypothetical protein [Pseudomonadota bacterium]
MDNVIMNTSGFVGGTLVHTNRGLVPIKDIKVGDMVLSRDQHNAEGELGCVDIYRIIDNHSVMTRLTLSDAQWAKIAPYCAGKETDVGRTAVNN